MENNKKLLKPKLLRWLSRLILKIYILIFLRLKLNVKYKLPKGPKIFAVNHPTTTDPFLIYATYPNAKMLISEDVFKIKILGWIFKKLGHIPTSKEKGLEAYNRAKEEISNGYSLIIFPEGYLSKKTHTLNNMKTGVVRLALETDTPIIPIGVSIEEKGIKHFNIRVTKKLHLRSQWYMRGKYTINVGKSMKLKGNSQNKEYVKKKSIHLQQEIQKLCRKK